MNYLCMPNAPDRTTANAGSSGTGAKIVAVRYERRANALNAAFNAAHNNVVACSVCEVEYTETMMQPAKQECPTGWEKIYQGYIMANWYNDAAETEHVCVNENVQHLGRIRTVSGISNGWQGKMFRTETETPLGEGHRQNYEVTCAVCGRR